jgi:hypothetical protein
MIAMRQRTGGTALEDVPTDNPMHGTIAEAGVKPWFAALSRRDLALDPQLPPPSPAALALRERLRPCVCVCVCV